MVFRDVIRVICCSLKNERNTYLKKKKKRIAGPFFYLKKQTCTICKSSHRDEQTLFGFLLIQRNQYCMNRAASVFPVDHYSYPPQTAHITRDHLANPWCEPLSDPFPALTAHVQTTLSHARSQFGSPFLACNISAGAAFLWGWPGSNGSDFPNRGTEMGGLTHPLICYTL